MKKNLLTVLIFALLIVNLALTSVMMFSVMNTNAKMAALVSNIATVMNLELTDPGEKGTPVVSLADTQVYTIPNSMTIALKNEAAGDKQAYMMFNIAFSLNMKHDDYKTYGETIADRESLIKDAVSSVVMSHTESECHDDIEGLKAEILEAVQNLFQSDFIYNVAINDIKFG